MTCPQFPPPKYRIVLFFVFGFLFLCCESKKQVQPATAPPAIEQFPDSARYAELQNNPAFRLNQIADSAREQGDYTKAIGLYQQAMDSAAVQADSFLFYDSKLDLACVYDRLDELPKSIEMAKTVIAAYTRSGDSSRIGRGYATLAAFYGRAGMTEENLNAARKGFEIVKNHGSLIERCAAYNQMAFTYSDRGRWTEALPLLDSALHFMKASGVLDQLSSMYLNLGNARRKLNRWDEARHYLHASAELADSLGQPHIRAVALLRLSQVAESTGNYADALALFQQSTALKDSIFTSEKTRAMQELEVAYETKEKEQELKILETNRKAEIMYRNFAMALLTLTLVVAAWQFWQWRIKHRLAQRQLDQKQLELHEFTQLLLIKNSRLAELENTVRTLSTPGYFQEKSVGISSEDPNDSGADTDEEVLYSQNILTDSDWVVFKSYFDKSYPGYRQRLRNTFPQLTSAEERIFLLIKLNLSSKEAAAMQGISLNSIKKYRYRLRKRLGLEQDKGLDQFVQEY